MQVVNEETEVENVVAQSDTVELRGPNRDQGSLLSFALRGDLTYKVLTAEDEALGQALVVTAPEHVIRKMAYDIVKLVEQKDMEQANTRVKED